jgi:hypothetical protein
MRRLSSTGLGITAALLMCSAGDGSAPVYAAELSNNVARAGILTDMSGSSSDISGPGAVEAAKLEADTAKFVKDTGGKVIGSVRHPFPTSDFSKVIAIANGGADMINSVRQAHEFGIIKGAQKLAALLPRLTDIHSIGLPAAQSIILTEGLYWDRTDEGRSSELYSNP